MDRRTLEIIANVLASEFQAIDPLGRSGLDCPEVGAFYERLMAKVRLMLARSQPAGRQRLELLAEVDGVIQKLWWDSTEAMPHELRGPAFTRFVQGYAPALFGRLI